MSKAKIINLQELLVIDFLLVSLMNIQTLQPPMSNTRKAAPSPSNAPKRKTITKQKAEKIAHPGEEWSDLYKRLSSQYIITS